MLQVWTRFSRSPDATSAIEFALVAPVLLLLLFGIIGYGYVLGVYHGVQQIAAEAARASVSGLNDTERERIARDFVTANVESYAFLDPAKIKVSTTASGAPTPTSASSSSSNSVPLKSLVSFGTLGDKPLSGANPIAVSLSALDMISALAQISNGARQIDIGLSLNIPGLAVASLKLGIGERPIGTSMVSVRRTGSSVHTAQTRLLLTIDLVGSGQASLVRLPLYLELASATAKLTNVRAVRATSLRRG